jgi:3'(2'), 5'-bisphosphate nucleotidase
LQVKFKKKNLNFILSLKNLILEQKKIIIYEYFSQDGKNMKQIRSNIVEKVIQDLNNSIPALFGISIVAGNAIKDVYNKDFKVDYKEDESPLTQADLMANDIIVKQLEKISDFPVISEENCKLFPYSVRKYFEYYWCVDPLDGTKEFVNKTDQFSVNIALMHKNKPIFGLIYAPILDIMYYAIQGMGSYKIANFSCKLKMTEKIHVKAKEKNAPYKILASRTFTKKEEAQKLITRLEKISPVEIGYMGSSLKMCLIAEGKADLYPRFGATCEWDMSAAEVILKEAGGFIIAIPSMKPLEYNKVREDFENPHLFAGGELLDEYFDQDYVKSCRLEK